MCDHENRERAMTVTARDENGAATVWCDPCLAPLIRALNNGGIDTTASCCGHDVRPGWVMLADGRVLTIWPTHDDARELDRRWSPDWHRADTSTGRVPPAGDARPDTTGGNR